MFSIKITLLHILAASLLCISSLFLSSQQFTDTQIVPKWMGAIVICLLIVMGSSCYYLLNIRIKGQNIIGIWCITIVSFCCLQAMYGIMQFAGLLSPTSAYPVTGSFDNPSGFASCLCIGITSASLLCTSTHRFIRYAAWITIVIMTAAVVLSESRAGMFSIWIVGIVYLWRIFHRKYYRASYALLAIIFCLSISCYWIKKDSADGRLYIWQCSLNMAMDAPLLGHGLNSFETHYMDYQAAYFKKNGQQSRFAILADNIKQPFNEYLHVWLNFGFTGLIALVLSTVWLVHCYHRHPSREKQTAFYILLSVAIFSFFSYPFTYPFTWIAVIWSVGLLAKELLEHLLTLPKVTYTICIIGLFVSLGGIYLWAERIKIEFAWNKALNLALIGNLEKALPKYRQLATFFASNPYFLYNYAAILQEDGQYAESQRIALLCRRYWADYDLELILGENYQHLQQTEQAIACYRHASLMCPSRFLPLYKLLRFYEERNKHKQMETVAREIIKKPIKIKTPTILMMKNEAKRCLKAKAVN